MTLLSNTPTRNSLASKKYRTRRKELAEKGDKKAIEQIKRDAYNSRMSNARTFINNLATKEDVLTLRNIIDENLKDPDAFKNR